MKKILGLLVALMASVSMLATSIQQDISLNASDWNWGWNCTVTNNGNLLDCTLTGEYGLAATGWGTPVDLSSWDRIVIVVENMSGCEGEYWKLKAFLRNDPDNINEEHDGVLGFDADDNMQNNLVIDLHKVTNVDLTQVKMLAIMCQPNGAVFKISRVYLEKEESAAGRVVFDWSRHMGTISYTGNVTETTVNTQSNTTSTACIAFSTSYYSSKSDEYTYAELSIAGGFKAGDVVSIDYCFNNSDNAKVATVGLFNTADSLLAESENGVNGRTADGVSTFQYELTEDMASIRVARGSRAATRTCITRLQVIRRAATFTDVAILSWQLGENGADLSNTDRTNTITGAAGSAAEGWTLSFPGNDKAWYYGNVINYNGVEYKSLKNALTRQITVTLPEGLYASQVEFYAVTNDNQYYSILTEFDGGVYADTVYSLKDFTNPIYIAKSLFYPKNSFTFTFGGKQVCFIALVTYSNEEPPVYYVTEGVSPVNAGNVEVTYNSNHTQATMTAIANDGYYFTSWNDGNTQNPRTIVMTHDTAFTAYFGKYYYVTTDADPAYAGSVSVVYDTYHTQATLTANPIDGYCFKYWDDRITTNPRTIHLSEDITCTAYFGKIYHVTANASPFAAGSVNVTYNADYSQATMTASANYGYYFDHWNDGNIENPRTIDLTQDVTYTASFKRGRVDPTQAWVWPIQMDNVTYAQNEQYVASDWRPNDTDSHLSIWGTPQSYNTQIPSDLNFYGNTEGYLALTVGDQYWSGGGFFLDYSSDVVILCQQIVVNPQDYYFHFAIKSTDDATHDFRLFGTDETVRFEIGNGSSCYGDFARDGLWHEFYVPMTQFASVLSQLSIKNVGNLFTFLSGGTEGTQLNLDAVYFCTAAYKDIQTGKTYTVTTNVYPLDAGTVDVNAESYWALLTAIGNTGYHFKRWNDGNLDNPRYVELTQDTTFTVLFERDVMEVTYIGMDGKVLGVENVQYGSRAYQRGIDADEFGYTFVGWSDDLSSVTTNMTVTAIYSRDAVNGFYYIYDQDARTAVLDREGNSYANLRKLNVPNNFIYRNIRFAVVAVGANAFENCDRLTDVVLPSNVENVEESAFSGCTDLVHLTMSAGLRGIADYAFNGCKRLEDITVYAQRVPDLTATSFNAIGNKKYVKVYVPDNRVNNYKRDEYWSEFNIVVKSAETVEGNVNDVTVEPEETSAQFTWPTENNAASYTIEITKDGVVFCTLIFNANGQLTGIAFAPGRNGTNAPMATLTTNGGMQFTVTGLDAGTSYAYTVTTKDTQDHIIATFEGSFETSGTMEDGILDVQSGTAPQKIMHNGQIYILRGEKVFTLQGVEVK